MQKPFGALGQALAAAGRLPSETFQTNALTGKRIAAALAT